MLKKHGDFLGEKFRFGPIIGCTCWPPPSAVPSPRFLPTTCFIFLLIRAFPVELFPFFFVFLFPLSVEDL